MLSVSKQYLYLVIDQTTKCVITNTISISTANAVSNGILNSSPMVIWFPYLDNKHDIIRANQDPNINYKLVKQFGTDFNRGNITVSDSHMYECVEKTPSGKMFDLVPMDENLITPEWTAKRRLANFRANLMMDLELHCDRYLARAVNFCGDELVFPYIQQQLSLSDPATEVYAPGIQEWALINEIPPAVAYQELKLKYDSACVTTMRLHAVWNKLVNKFNLITLEDGLTHSEIFKNMTAYFMFGEV